MKERNRRSDGGFFNFKPSLMTISSKAVCRRTVEQKTSGLIRPLKRMRGDVEVMLADEKVHIEGSKHDINKCTNMAPS